jgi:hypothetical protein
MRYAVRLRAGLVALATALLPSAALAQAAGGADPAPGGRDFTWLWIIATALVLVALFRMFFARSHGTPARRP